MTQKGEHTWDLHVDYQRCPDCGNINESRVEFQQHKELWSNEIMCTRGGHTFIVSKKRKKTFGPLFGTPQPPEFNWEEKI